jgi:hypothetical protein
MLIRLIKIFNIFINEFYEGALLPEKAIKKLDHLLYVAIG